MMKNIKVFDQWPIVNTFAVVLVVFLYGINLTSAHIIDKLISKSFFGSFLSEIFLACNASQTASVILLATYVFCLAFVFAKSIRNRADLFSISFILLALAVWIGVDDFWVYPSVSGWAGDFKWWLVGGLSINAIAIMLTSYHSNLIASSPHEASNGSHGFSPEKQASFVDTHNNLFITKLIDKLKNTDVTETAFSLGIVGEWGAGKTVFLNSMQERIESEGNATVIVFNPWLGLSDQSLVQSFFSSLSDKIKEDPTIELESSLKEYADALVAIEGEGGIVAKALSLFGVKSEKNIFVLKRRIAEILKNSNRNIYILIDDLDRLSGDELYDVLKLIRITADFPHLFYITAFDRNYVESALAGYGIDESKRYLDKIFNVEVTLPKATSNQLTSLFKEEIKTVDSSLDEATVEVWAKWAIKYLPTFRDIKRFVRQYSLIESHMEAHVSEDEYSKQDLFMLELLKYYDSDLYKKIRDQADKYFKYNLNHNGAFWFEAISKEDGELQITTNSQQLLQRLFNNEKPDPRSIKYLSNFQRYFTYRLEENVIKNEDFNRWKSSHDEEATSIFQSMKQQAGSSHSLLFHLSFLSAENLTTSRMVDICNYLLPFSLDKNKRGMSARKILYSLIRQSFSDEANVDIDAYFEWFENYLNNSGLSFSDKGRLLKMIRTNCDEATEQIGKLEKSNFVEFLNAGKPNAADIAHSNSMLSELYSNSITWTQTSYYDPAKGEDVLERKGYSALFDVLIEHFQKYPGDQESRTDFYETMFCFPYTDEYGETFMDEYAEEDAMQVAVDVFGSYENYREYYSKAFKTQKSD